MESVVRLKSQKYLNWVRSLPCSVTGGCDVHAHHLIGYNQGGMGLKASDYLAFPLCAEEHTKLHHYGWKEWEVNNGSQWEHVAKTLHKALEIGLITVKGAK